MMVMLSSVLRVVNKTITETRMAPGIAVQMYKPTETIRVQVYSRITGPSIVCATQIIPPGLKYVIEKTTLVESLQVDIIAASEKH
jgi:hypothetical protein